MLLALEFNRLTICNHRLPRRHRLQRPYDFSLIVSCGNGLLPLRNPIFIPLALVKLECI